MEEVTTSDEMAELLRTIADMVEKGFTSGYYPTWDLEGFEEPDKQ
jgi:hypothetical protein